MKFETVKTASVISQYEKASCSNYVKFITEDYLQKYKSITTIYK